MIGYVGVIGVVFYLHRAHRGTLGWRLDTTPSVKGVTHLHRIDFFVATKAGWGFRLMYAGFEYPQFQSQDLKGRTLLVKLLQTEAFLPRLVRVASQAVNVPNWSSTVRLAHCQRLPVDF